MTLRWRTLLALAAGLAVVPLMGVAGAYADEFVMQFPLMPVIGVLALLGMILGSGLHWASGNEAARTNFYTLLAFGGGIFLSGGAAILLQRVFG